MPLPKGYTLVTQPDAGNGNGADVAPGVPAGYTLVPNDARSALAERKAHPPAAAHGDPNGHDATFMERAFPYLAHPIETAKGFAETLNPLPMVNHPLDAIQSDLDARKAAFERLQARGAKKILTTDPADPQSGADFLDAFESVVPGVGPAVANASREMQSPDPSKAAHGFGSAVALTSGPKIVEKVGGPIVRGIGNVIERKPDPLQITRKLKGGYDEQRGINVGQVLGESGVPVDVNAVKKNPAALSDHFKALLDHQNKLADVKLSGPEGQATLPAEQLKQLMPAQEALTKSGDAAIQQAVKDWYDSAIDAATDKNGGVTIQSLDKIKQQLQARTAYEKIFGNADVNPIHDAATASLARQLDHIGDEHVTGYEQLNDRRAALSHTLKESVYPAVDASAKGITGGSALMGRARAGAGAATAALVPGSAATGFAARQGMRGLEQMDAAARTTVDPVAVARTINKQITRYNNAGSPKWGLDTAPAEAARAKRIATMDAEEQAAKDKAAKEKADQELLGKPDEVLDPRRFAAKPVEPKPPTAFNVVDWLRNNDAVRIPGENNVQMHDSRSSAGPQQLDEYGKADWLNHPQGGLGGREAAVESSRYPRKPEGGSPLLDLGPLDKSQIPPETPPPTIDQFTDPRLNKPALLPMRETSMQPSSGGKRFTGTPDGQTIDTQANYDILPQSHRNFPNPGLDPNALPIKSFEGQKANAAPNSVLDILRPAGQSAPAGEAAVSMTQSQNSGAAGQMGGPALGQEVKPNLTTTGTADGMPPKPPAPKPVAAPEPPAKQPAGFKVTPADEKGIQQVMLDHNLTREQAIQELVQRGLLTT